MLPVEDVLGAGSVEQVLLARFPLGLARCHIVRFPVALDGPIWNHCILRVVQLNRFGCGVRSREPGSGLDGLEEAGADFRPSYKEERADVVSALAVFGGGCVVMRRARGLGSSDVFGRTVV